MRITMKALCALPEGALEPGKTYDRPPKQAKTLIADGYAVAEGDDPATKSPEERQAKTKRRRGARKETAQTPSADGNGGQSGSDDGGQGDDNVGDADTGGDGDTTDA